MLQEIRKGLQLYGLGGLMEKHPEICQPLFVPGTETVVVVVVVVVWFTIIVPPTGFRNCGTGVLAHHCCLPLYLLLLLGHAETTINICRLISLQL